MSESGGTAEAWGCQIDGEEVGTTSTVEHVGVMVHRRVCKEEDKAGRPAREGGRWAGRWRRGRQAPPKSKSVIADTTSNARRGRRRGGWSGGGDGASSGLHGLPHPGHGRKPCLSSLPPSSGSGCATHRSGCHVTSSTPTPTGSPLASSSTTMLHYHAVPTTPSQLRRSTTHVPTTPLHYHAVLSRSWLLTLLRGTHVDMLRPSLSPPPLPRLVAHRATSLVPFAVPPHSAWVLNVAGPDRRHHRPEGPPSPTSPRCSSTPSPFSSGILTVEKKR